MFQYCKIEVAVIQTVLEKDHDLVTEVWTQRDGVWILTFYGVASFVLGSRLTMMGLVHHPHIFQVCLEVGRH